MNKALLKWRPGNYQIMGRVIDHMLRVGVKCLYCTNKMEKTTKPDTELASGLFEFVCPYCRFVAHFVGDGNKELNYYGVRMCEPYNP